MINYNFITAFGPQIATGAPNPKTLTLRRGRKLPSRHANVGEPVGLWTGLRTVNATRQGVGLVTLRGLLRFRAEGIVFVSELKLRDALDASTLALERELLNRDDDAFARRDGFENYASLWKWHDASRDPEERRHPALVRHVIAWLPLKAEQISAIDSGAARLEEVA